MRKILLLSFILPLSLTMQAQTQIENPGFEGAWEDVSGSEDEPINWSSLKSCDNPLLWGSVPVVAFKETVAPHSGAYCLKLKNYSLTFGVVPNGIITNGRVHAEIVAANGYVSTVTSDNQWHTACADRPDSLVGWYKYAPQGSDKGKFELLLHDDSQIGKLPEATAPQPNWVGKARYDVTSAQATWTRFSVPFSYFNTNTPDYFVMVISSGDSTMAVVGSELWIDDLALIYNPNVASITPPAPQNIDIGMNGALLTLDYTANAEVVTTVSHEWKYATTSGGSYSSFGTPQTGTTYTPNFAAAGIYYVVCEVDFGTEVIISNEVEIVVTDPAANTVTISPSAPQTLLVGDNGTLMNATESPVAASSREWMYSTTSGSGYISFGTPVTGLTYTPNFNAVGTYYVICESDFAGDVQVSNEVTILVPSAAGIDEPNLQFNIFNTGNDLAVRLSDIQTNSTLTIYSLDGKLIYSAALTEENSLHHVDANGVFVYHVVSGDKIITGKINL